MRARRWFAVPSWTERAVLVGVATWLLLYCATRVLEAINTAGGFLLPSVPTGPNSWRPAEPLGNLPFRLQIPLMLATPLMLLALIALGLASWGDRGKWRRFLVVFGLADALILLMAYQAITAGDARSNTMSYALHQLMTAPFVFIGVTLAWSSRTGRSLAIAGTTILAAVYASVYWLDGGFSADHWMSDPTRLAIFWVARSFVWALVPGLIGAGILLASRPSRPSGSPTSAGAPPSPSTR